MKDKVALVTGSNGGLGRHVTRALLDARRHGDWGIAKKFNHRISITHHLRYGPCQGKSPRRLAQRMWLMWSRLVSADWTWWSTLSVASPVASQSWIPMT